MMAETTKTEKDVLENDTCGREHPANKTTDENHEDNGVGHEVDEKSAVENKVEPDPALPDADKTEDGCPRDTKFSSENFKLEITNLPKYYGFKELKKRLERMGLKPHKLKAMPRQPFAFVCFSNEAEKEAALQAINGHVWKGKPLMAKKARAAHDPLKRKIEEDASAQDDEKKAKLDDRPPHIRLRDSVEVLWMIPYEKQLEEKTLEMKKIMKNLASQRELKGMYHEDRQKNEHMCCPLLPIVPSPVLNSYRNKNEFSVGKSENLTETVVGFRFGLYKKGTVCVASPKEVSTLPLESKMVAEKFQVFVRQSKYEPFDHRTHAGHWRQLTVRTTLGDGGIMAIAEFVINDVAEVDLEAEKAALSAFFTEGEGKDATVTTLYFRPCSWQTSNSTSSEPYQLLFGDGHITESLMGLKFRISPSAFFQVNTLGAEKMINLIGEWSNASASTTLLDVCCGTGTIGLCLAKSVKEVIGIEMCKEAVGDARHNTSLNGVTNCTYHCAKVEDVISDIVRNTRNSEDVVALVDPPRAGMHPRVVKALRGCRGLHRIVFAACAPQSSKPNFLDLMRPSTGKLPGRPFRLTRAVPVDMFPQTNACELLLLFERNKDGGKTEEIKTQTEETETKNVEASKAEMSCTEAMKIETSPTEMPSKVDTSATETSNTEAIETEAS